MGGESSRCCYLLLYTRVVEATAEGPFRERLGRLIDAWVSLIEEHLEAVLFVNETLRDFWPHMPPRIARKSLLKHLASVVRDGQSEGVVPSWVDPELAVAMLVGTLGQVARQRFFGGFRDLAVVRPTVTLLLAQALSGSAPSPITRSTSTGRGNTPSSEVVPGLPFC